MLSKTIGDPTSRAAIKKGIHAPAANTAAIITLAATTGKQHMVLGVQWSYSVSPTGGRLTIVDGSTTIVDLDISGSGPGGFSFSLPGTTNTAMVITLASGTGSCVGKLSAQYVTEREGMM